MTAAESLELSRSAHAAYREALPHRVPNGAGGTTVVPGNAEAAGLALAAACRYRADAHVIDRDRVDPSWADEAATHDHLALLDFYVEQLTREPEGVQKAVDAMVTIEATRDALEPATVDEVGLGRLQTTDQVLHTDA